MIGYSHLAPKSHAALYAIRGNRLATFFAFKSERLNLADRQAQFDLLTDVFGNQGWIIPQLVEATKPSAHFYFDRVSQIKSN